LPVTEARVMRKSSRIRRVAGALVGASRAMLSHETPSTAAAISYFSLFGLFPATLVMVALVDAMLGWLDLHDTVLERIVDLFPASRVFLEVNLSELIDPSPALVVSCLIVLLWSSNWVFMCLENAMNAAWAVQRRRTFWESRLLSITFLTLGGIMLLASTGLTLLVSAIRSSATAGVPEFVRDEIINSIWSTLILTAGFLIATLVFLLVYKLMPDRTIRWREAFSGAIVASTLWEVSSNIFVKLVPFFDYERVYGTMGAVITILAWVYTSSFIMLFGANFSAQLHRPWLEPQSAVPSVKDVENPSISRVRPFSRPR
jgi:membrane protein